MKSILKKILPEWVFRFYHFTLAWTAVLLCGMPSRKLIVIGVTGTKGKTSAINYIWSVLTASNIKTGIITTANVRIGDKEILNPFHMTMPGKFQIQKFLKQMVSEKVEVAIVETTSQGILQYRHLGIDYDVAIFTNLSPEHIDAHKTFENYKQTKGKLFELLHKTKQKSFHGEEFPKTIIANVDNEHAPYFLSFDASKKITFSINQKSDFQAVNISTSKSGSEFDVASDHYALSILGVFNIYNALPAIAVATLFSIPSDIVSKGVSGLSVIPGRMEEVIMGQDFRVFVDYAHEKQSMNYVVEAGNTLKASGKLIILLGAEGGGRDKAKRADMGHIVGKYADLVVVSNVDPYEDDPTPIVEDIARVAESEGKERDKNLFVIEDRRQGVSKSLSMASAGDVVIITGKGAEQSMIIGGQSIPWDDRDVVREELKKILR